MGRVGRKRSSRLWEYSVSIFSTKTVHQSSISSLVSCASAFSRMFSQPRYATTTCPMPFSPISIGTNHIPAFFS